MPTERKIYLKFIRDPLDPFWKWFHRDLKPISYCKSDERFIISPDQSLLRDVIEVMVDATSATKLTLKYPDIIIKIPPATERQLAVYNAHRMLEKQKLNSEYGKLYKSYSHYGDLYKYYDDDIDG